MMHYNNLMNAYDLFHEGILALTDVQNNGICVNIDYYNRTVKKLDSRIQQLEGQIRDYKEVIKWKADEDKQFNINSTPQLKNILCKQFKYKPTKLTDKGNVSIDEEVLKKIDIPFTNDILEYKKLYKLAHTYLEGFIRESINGIIHPFFNLHLVTTYRSSSSNPNFQNIPKRNKFAQMIARMGIIPRKNRLLLEVDYDSMEVRISCCYHKDPRMITYIEDDSTDMHRDQAIELFLLDKNQITEELRDYSKKDFVFPEFYGDYYVNCARNLWNDIQYETIGDISFLEHLKDKNIGDYKSFERHVKKVEDRFWNEKFKVYAKWKKTVWNKYQKNGYVDLLTGFRCSGFMKRNDVINYPVQGTAFHCLLWSLIQLNKVIKEQKLESLIISQVHDDILNDVVEGELEYIKKIVKKIMCKYIRDHWEWIIIPLNISAKISEVNGNWYKMKKIKI